MRQPLHGPVRRTQGIGIALGIVVASGCSRPDAAARPMARVDTLPSGIIQVTSDQPTRWADSSSAWRLVEVARIAPEDGAPGELVEPGTIGVDGSGRIYVSDSKPTLIKVYDAAGNFVRAIGGEGRGPGEFTAAFVAVKGGTVVVHDPQQSRTSVFDTTGTLVTSWQSSCCYWTDIAIDRADRIYIPIMTRRDSTGASRGAGYARYRQDGSLIDTLWVPLRERDEKSWVFVSKGKDGTRRGMMSTNVPFTPSMVWTINPAGGFVEGWNGEYRLVRSPTGEDTVSVFGRHWTPDPIPDAMRRAPVDRLVRNATNMVGEAVARSVARLEEVPTTAPAFVTIRVDLDGNTWARRLIGSDSTRTTYDVFDPDGAWLGAVVSPVAVPEWGGQFFGRGLIYTATEDQDGRPNIVVLRVVGRP